MRKKLEPGFLFELDFISHALSRSFFHLNKGPRRLTLAKILNF